LKRYLNLFLIFISISISGFAQTRCGYSEYMEYLYKQNPELKKENQKFKEQINKKILEKSIFKSAYNNSNEEVFEIPVVVHVIHSVASGAIINTNISDAQILSQIDKLNEDFAKLNADTADIEPMFQSLAADTKIRFCLASTDPEGNPTNGIVRVYENKTSFSINDDARIKKLSIWPTNMYLNVWVCNLENPYLGYAAFPGGSTLLGIPNSEIGDDTNDGIVMDYQDFGSIGTATFPYDMGRTLTHEAAHWLGLLHIWGDSDCGDDHVSDTPVQKTYNVGSTCFSNYSNCTGSGATLDMNQNYMDYSADACMYFFTHGQQERMQTVIQMSSKRAALKNSIGCCPFDTIINLPYYIDFESDAFVDEKWTILNFDNANPNSRLWEKKSPSAKGEGLYSLSIRNDSVYSSVRNEFVDLFESPYYINLDVDFNPVLDFDLAYAYNSSGLNTDSLVVSYIEGCKKDWTELATIVGSELISTERRMNQFIPNNNEWKKISISLDQLKGKKYVRFKIADYSKGVNNLYIDNISFYKESTGLMVKLFPVPSFGELNLEAIFTGYKDVKVEMYNALARKVFNFEKKGTASIFETFDVTRFPAGIYVVKVSVGNEFKTIKIVIN